MLTKSQFLRGYDCERRLWLDIHRRDLRKELTESEIDRIETGKRLGEMARLLFPDGELVPRTKRLSGDEETLTWEVIEEGVFVPRVLGDLETDAALTQEMIGAGKSCLFEATFLDNGLAARVDILSKTEAGWMISEAKSSSVKPPKKINPNKILDLAFQLYTVRKAGLDVRRAELILVDTEYKWDAQGAYGLDLLGRVDVTEECEKLAATIELRVNSLRTVEEQAEEPDVELNTHCKTCGFFDYCHRNTDLHDLIFLPRVTRTDVRRLRGLDLRRITDIPEEGVKISEAQRRVRNALVQGVPFVAAELGESLDKIRFPAAFVDFETVASALPPYSGTRPYQQICFQWSAHILKGENQKPVHREFLAEGPKDPREAFCRTLWALVKNCDSLVHYTAFEITQIKAMANEEIPLAKELLERFQDNSYDLETVVREKVYFEAFRGRSSIKVVLPALVPSMSYKNLRIADGNAAATAFRRTLDPSVTQEEIGEIRSGLLEYCKQDTLAMVEIFKALRSLTLQGKLL